MSKIDIDKLVASVYKHEVQKLPSGGQWSTTLWTLDEVLREQGLKYKAGEIVGIEPNLSNVSENGKECKPANFAKSSKDLQESEDEKIRKWIINEIKIKHHNLDEENVDFVDKAIAWLEKQGKVKESFISQHEIETCKENNNSLTSEDEKVRKALLELAHDTTGDELWIDYNVHKEEALDWLEKQSEKPADKIEPKFKVGDKIYLKPEYRMPDDDTPIANTVKEIRRIDDKHYRFDGAYIFIEDQDKYELVEQKAEENKGNLGGISSNWSEEDEQYVEDAIALIQRGLSYLSEHTIGQVQEWLKSLKGRVKPQWKPSDEQMEALYKASKNEYLKADQYDVLLELWNNLKKLKEE